MSSWEILKEKGNEEFKKGNFSQAINHYTEAISSNDNQEVLYTNRALCFININQIKKAIYDLNKAININPKSIKAMKRLSNVRILQGEFGEAKMLLEKCVCLEPKIQEHLEDLKGVQMSIKSLEDIYTLKDSQSPDYEKLELSCSNMLTKCKEFSALKIIYINTLLNNCKPQVAISFLNSKLNEDEKTNEEFEYLTALALYYDGRIDNAKKFLSVYMQKSLDSQKFKKLNQLIKETESEKEKANSIFKLGNFDEAINYYTKILNLDPSNKIFNATIYNNRALCLQKKNKLLEALADVNTAIGLNANYSKAYLRRGNINMSLAYYEEAKYDFQKAKDLDPSNTDINRLLEEAKKQEKQAKRKDYYKILDLEKGANEADVRKAYRKLAIKWHPDKNSETEEQNKHAEKMFKDINEAYSVLSDPKKKQMFDNGIYPDENGYDDQGFGGGVNPNDIFSMFMGGGFQGNSDFGGSGRSGQRIVFNFGDSGFSGGSNRGKKSADPFGFFFN